MSPTCDEKLAGKFNLTAYQDALTLAKVGIWEIDLETDLLHLNEEHLAMLGNLSLPHTLPMSEYITRFVFEEDQEDLSAIVPKIRSNEWSQQHSEVEYRIKQSDGELVHVYVKMNFQRLHENILWGITQNITSTRKAENQLNNTLRLLADLKFALDESTLVTVTDVKGRITYVNEHFCNISGYSKDELMGKSHNITNAGYHPKSFFREMWNTISSGNIWRGEICNKKKSGEVYWVDTTIVPFVDQHGLTYQYTAIRTDITSRKEAEFKISHMAYHDSLTGLPNRRNLMSRLEGMLASQNSSELLGVALFDMDNFKYINDHHGHQAGDDLLKMAARRLDDFLIEDEIAARLGGDEFVIAIPGLSSEEALKDRINDLISHMKDPYMIEEQPYYLSLSIGSSCTKKDEKTTKELLKQADFAMYESKNGNNKGLF